MKPFTPMNPTRIVRLALAATLLLAGAAAAPATEETGRVIEKLVAEVDQQLGALEKLTDQTSGDKERLKSALDAQFAKYDAAANDAARADARGEIVQTMARMNATDRKEADLTLSTVVKVGETMRKLASTVQANPNFNPDTLKAQQERLGKFVVNAAKIVRTLEASGDATTRHRSAALKNSLIMLNRQLSDPYTGTANALARIQTTVSTLEDVAVQMHILQGLLENERVMLLTATHVQTVDLALLRLARAKLGSDVVANIPAAKHGDVVERIRRVSGPLNSAGASVLAGGEVSDSDAFELISAEEFNRIQ